MVVCGRIRTRGDATTTVARVLRRAAGAVRRILENARARTDQPDDRSHQATAMSPLLPARAGDAGRDFSPPPDRAALEDDGVPRQRRDRVRVAPDVAGAVVACGRLGPRT